MERWRSISLTGIVLGLVLQAIDLWGASIPYIIMIPLEIAAIILIFYGLILRKRIRRSQITSQ